MYLVIVDPPLLTGAVNVTRAEVELNTEADTAVGVSGTFASTVNVSEMNVVGRAYPARYPVENEVNVKFENVGVTE
jgi:hypothetical protein